MNTFLQFLMTLAALPTVIQCNMWIKVSVKKIERKQCIIDQTSWGSEATGCAQMSYMTIEERMMPTHERRSTSFEHIEGVTRPTVTHWPSGKFVDWMMAIQFVAVDPVYGIARTCDRSGYVRVFQEGGEAAIITHSDDADSQHFERTIKIQGQCFTATVNVEASKDICPWCVEEAAVQNSPTVPPTAAPSVDTTPKYLLIMILVLTIISIVALTATGVLMIVYLFDRRRQSNATAQVFEAPPPENAHRRRLLSQSTWMSVSQSSGETWCEMPSDRWTCLNRTQDLDDVAPIPFVTKESAYYDVTPTCSTPDSGRASF